MAPIAGNVIINMANNYCYRFHCHELFEQLKTVIAESNGSKRAIYKLLVEHFGRIISAKKDSFIGELNEQLHPIKRHKPAPVYAGASKKKIFRSK